MGIIRSAAVYYPLFLKFFGSLAPVRRINLLRRMRDPRERRVRVAAPRIQAGTRYRPRPLQLGSHIVIVGASARCLFPVQHRPAHVIRRALSRGPPPSSSSSSSCHSFSQMTSDDNVTRAFRGYRYRLPAVKIVESRG